MLSLLGKRYLINEPICVRNKLLFDLSPQRGPYFPRRPRTLIDKLLQSLNISTGETIRHGFNGLTLSVHQETSNVFLGMLSPFRTSHGQNYVSQEGLQLQSESFYLSGFHTQKDTSKGYRMSR
jgi:hypothetical protein